MYKEDIISAGLKTSYDNFYVGKDERWRLLSAKYKALNIIEVCNKKKFTKVLEVGAGDGSILKYLNEANFSAEVHAIEISQSGVDQIEEKKISNLKSVQVFDGYRIPFEDNEFELVILSHVLEHVEFERMLLREIKRVSEYVVIEVPRDYRYDVDQRMKHFLSYGHINVYTPTSLRFLVQSEGFEVIADKISLIEPEVTKFNTFINLKKTKTLINSLFIDAEFWLKNILIKMGGKRRLEKFASAYTVLLRKTKGANILS
jgi:ubiquinone/menaquinone biosynthesis C-methylase UbiE